MPYLNEDKVFEIAKIVDDPRQIVETANGWTLQFFFTYNRTKDVSLGVECKGYTAVIINNMGNVDTVFFAHRKYFMIEYLKKLSGCDDVVTPDANNW